MHVKLLLLLVMKAISEWIIHNNLIIHVMLIRESAILIWLFKYYVLRTHEPIIFLLVLFFLLHLFLYIFLIAKKCFPLNCKAIEFLESLKTSEQIVNLLLLVKVDSKCAQIGHSLKGVHRSLYIVNWVPIKIKFYHLWKKNA